MWDIPFCSIILFVSEKCLSRKSFKFLGLANKQTFVLYYYIYRRGVQQCVRFMLVGSKPSFIFTNDVRGGFDILFWTIFRCFAVNLCLN